MVKGTVNIYGPAYEILVFMARCKDTILTLCILETPKWVL